MRAHNVRLAVQPMPEPDGTFRYVRLNDEYIVPAEFAAEDDTVSLLVEVDDDGTYRCTAVQIRGDNLTSDDLRLPLMRMIRMAVSLAAITIVPGGTEQVPPGAVINVMSRQRLRDEDFYADFVVKNDRPRRGAAVTDEHLQRVADVYQAAVENGDPPNRTIEALMHASRPTVYRWVARARDRGFLDASLPRKAGEKVAVS